MQAYHGCILFLASNSIYDGCILCRDTMVAFYAGIPWKKIAKDAMH
jgi:hypothetical protein